MQAVWYYLGYDTDDSPYKVKGTLYKDSEENFSSKYVISMEYDNFRYAINMDVDISMTTVFVNYFIRNIKKMIEGEIDSFVLDGESNLQTEFCRLYKKDDQYYITHLRDSVDDWIIKFDNNFGPKLLDVLENMLEEIQK